MYEHTIERSDFDSEAENILDKFLNDGWILLSHRIYASEKGKDFTRSNSGFQHVLVFQKFTPEKYDTVSEEQLSIFDEFAVKETFADAFISE